MNFSEASRCAIQEADAHDLKAVPSESIGIYSISFGMKICRRDRVIAEAFRVLKPGDAFYRLEALRIVIPPLHALYLKYMDWRLPTSARLATGGDGGAHDYILKGKGVHDLPGQDAFAKEPRTAGFESVWFENLTLGIVAIHDAIKPPRTAVTHRT